MASYSYTDTLEEKSWRIATENSVHGERGYLAVMQGAGGSRGISSGGWRQRTGLHPESGEMVGYPVQ